MAAILLFLISCLFIQKNSPYIEEVNSHLQDLVELGFFQRWKAESLGNATKCDTLSKKLNSRQETLTVLNMSHVGSTFVLTMGGLVVGGITYLCEIIMGKCSRDGVVAGRSKQGIQGSKWM